MEEHRERGRAWWKNGDRMVKLTLLCQRLVILNRSMLTSVKHSCRMM
ncbi:hypothetical protein T05_8503 [Trichinella murrelli]|uniref:Uncharacterized protein n=1 Tax=Trichinella murrelli TaxID=144512 RepID=A0A0V0TW50_9BILA|nr:hypothetical protein T05_8503 [Trichinella murrelli]